LRVKILQYEPFPRVQQRIGPCTEKYTSYLQGLNVCIIENKYFHCKWIAVERSSKLFQLFWNDLSARRSPKRMLVYTFRYFVQCLALFDDFPSWVFGPHSGLTQFHFYYVKALIILKLTSQIILFFCLQFARLRQPIKISWSSWIETHLSFNE